MITQDEYNELREEARRIHDRYEAGQTRIRELCKALDYVKHSAGEARILADRLEQTGETNTPMLCNRLDEILNKCNNV